jgi:hypothetical protein
MYPLRLCKHSFSLNDTLPAATNPLPSVLYPNLSDTGFSLKGTGFSPYMNASQKYMALATEVAASAA